MRNCSLSLAVLSVACSAVSGATIHVPADHATIQAAIDTASDGDEIVVAPGTYNELINFNGKAITLRSTDPTNPAVVAATIIDAGPVPDPGTGKPVVRCDSGEGPDTVLDGFTITGGTGDTALVPLRGGGMLNEHSSPTVINCTFTGNTADSGGGIFNRSASPTVMNCMFVGNEANDGGGIVNSWFVSHPTISNCEFLGNSAEIGAGIRNGIGGGATITDCTFKGNVAVEGGGIYSWTAEPVTVSNSIFMENTAARGGAVFDAGVRSMTHCDFLNNAAEQDGGGIYTYYESSLIDCLFSGNTAGGDGGGIWNQGWLEATNCRFRENSAERDGGAIRVFLGYLDATNCLFTGNVAMNSGGAIMAFINGDLVLTNCTLAGNSAMVAGALVAGDTYADILNGIFWGNGPDAIWVFDASAVKAVVTVDFSNVQGGWTGPGSNNIDADPLFVAGPLGDFYLAQTAAGQGTDSPCVDAGNAQQSVFFLKGTTRTDDVGDLGIVDMGFHYDAGLGSVDFDGDDDADVDDFLTFANCFAGALKNPMPGCQSPATDLDDDGDVDGTDFLTFSNCFNGALNPPACP